MGVWIPLQMADSQLSGGITESAYLRVESHKARREPGFCELRLINLWVTVKMVWPDLSSLFCGILDHLLEKDLLSLCHPASEA